MSTVLLSTIPGHAPVLMGAFPEQMVIASIFTLTTLRADRAGRQVQGGGGAAKGALPQGRLLHG